LPFMSTDAMHVKHGEPKPTVKQKDQSNLCEYHPTTRGRHFTRNDKKGNSR